MVHYQANRGQRLSRFIPQVAQARNMSIGEHRHCLPLYREKIACVQTCNKGNRRRLHAGKEKTVYIKTHKAAINRSVDPTGET